MFIEDIITIGKMVIKDNFLKTKKLTVSQRFKSLSQAASESTYFFPIVCSDQLTPDELMIMMKMFERNYAIFTRTAFSLIPFINMDNTDTAIKEHLLKVHQNIGFMPHSGFKQISIGESSFERINYGILNEQNAAKKIMDKINTPKEEGSKATYSTTQALDQDWKKANEVMPTTIVIPLQADKTKIEIPVHIKAMMHKVPTQVLVKDIVGSVNQSKGFLNFVKYISGEQKSLMDFLFGISYIKDDVLNRSKSPWLDAFKRRRRLAKLAWGVVANNYKPIGTIVITMNEVNILKNQYDIDVFKEAKKIMNQYYLLGFTILDQTNEIAHVLFDSYPDFQEYPYRTLEREANNQDKTLREMIRAMGRV